MENRKLKARAAALDVQITLPSGNALPRHPDLRWGSRLPMVSHL